MDYQFVKNEIELTLSVVEFFNKPQFWRTAIGNSPKYFVHIKNDKEHYFGLSKFCAFKNIEVEDYVRDFRYKTDGGFTQKHISKLTGKNWTPRNIVGNDIREAFDQWITQFHPNYNLDNASFITVSESQNIKYQRAKFIDPKTLEEKLKLQREIGDIGEQIAIEYELNRLRNNGIKNAEKYIEHTSKINSAAGFDISCVVKDDNRFIEVKSSLNNNLDFFITENEYQTLEKLGDNAFIYLVHISDLIERKGIVFHIVKNPIVDLKTNGNLKPIAYKASFIKE